MDFIARKRGFIVFGVVWGFALAALPAFFAFDDPFTLSPFLVSAFVCSMLAGVAGALFAGKWVSGRTGLFAGVFAGILHGVVFSVAVSVGVWICLAVNISGFSTAAPGNIFNLVGNPGIFEMSGIAAWAIFLYTLAAGVVLSPISGGVILRMSRSSVREAGVVNAGKGSV